jgi:hypothetical protein
MEQARVQQHGDHQDRPSEGCAKPVSHRCRLPIRSGPKWPLPDMDAAKTELIHPSGKILFPNLGLRITRHLVRGRFRGWSPNGAGSLIGVGRRCHSRRGSSCACRAPRRTARLRPRGSSPGCHRASVRPCGSIAHLIHVSDSTHSPVGDQGCCDPAQPPVTGGCRAHAGGFEARKVVHETSVSGGLGVFWGGHTPDPCIYAGFRPDRAGVAGLGRGWPTLFWPPTSAPLLGCRG